MVSRYISLAYEPEAVANNFFEQSIDLYEFVWFFPPMMIIWNGLVHLHNYKSSGVGVFVMWTAIPLYSMFIKNCHLSAC